MATNQRNLLKKATFWSLCCLLFSGPISAQKVYPAYGLNDFVETADPETYDSKQWDDLSSGLHAAWGSIDTLYKKGNVPANKIKQTKAVVWKGEKVNFIALAYTKNEIKDVKCVTSDLKGISSIIPAGNVKSNFVRYTLSDKFKISDEILACAARTPHKTENSHLVPDVLDYIPQMTIPGRTTRPIWITVEIPRDIPSGEYTGEIFIRSAAGEDQILSLTVEVLDHIVPAPKDWQFHLDLWQNCVSVKRYHKPTLWSDEHFEILAEYFKILADAGQKVCTAVINHGGQSFDDWYESMILWTKKADGTWFYDYTVFDKFVNMMASIGIDQQINCYSMYPWGATRYFDEKSGDWISIQPEPGTQEFADFWRPFLLDFREHLKENGWFEKTAIAMDEKLEPIMAGVISFIKETTPDFKIALAGGYIPSLQEDIYDLSIFVGHPTTSENMQARIAQGKPTTFYTSCSWPEHPNQFTFSPPAESALVGWFAYAQGYTGFLRWAYNIWVQNVLKDTRCASAPAGDQHMVYPGPRNSVRMARLREGIQDYEKLRVIMERLKGLGTPEANENIQKLQRVLQTFSLGEISKETDNRITSLVNDAKAVLTEVAKATPVNMSNLVIPSKDRNTIEIYPNPTDDKLFISYDGDTEKISYQICSTSGQVMQTSNTKPVYKYINIKNIPSGNYIIKFNVGSQVISKKFIKN